jgi:hyperosmotically inducible protein
MKDGIRWGMRRVASLVLVGLALLLLSTEGCSGAGMGYRAAYKAARSELSATTLARDQRLKLHLREAILLDQTYAGLEISPYVYMERGFVVGSVETVEQADGILRAARTVQGLRSLYGHLPVRKEVTEENEETGGSISDLTITTEVKANLVLVPGILASQIEIQVLGGDVVLLGVVASEEVRGAAEREARLVSGVKGVTNLLLLPESGYMKRRPRLLR